ncbi:hypothetical protein, partial [Alkalihalobacillus alcalophilus]|uniref:hypothetical protein n=1 Tax=Alkalihalobacillus alcalophilus TaxID=1445 RepID=UPI001F2CD630
NSSDSQISLPITDYSHHNQTNPLFSLLIICYSHCNQMNPLYHSTFSCSVELADNRYGMPRGSSSPAECIAISWAEAFLGRYNESLLMLRAQ